MDESKVICGFSTVQGVDAPKPCIVQGSTVHGICLVPGRKKWVGAESVVEMSGWLEAEENVHIRAT